MFFGCVLFYFVLLRHVCFLSLYFPHAFFVHCFCYFSGGLSLSGFVSGSITFAGASIAANIDYPFTSAAFSVSSLQLTPQVLLTNLTVTADGGSSTAYTLSGGAEVTLSGGVVPMSVVGSMGGPAGDSFTGTLQSWKVGGLSSVVAQQLVLTMTGMAHVSAVCFVCALVDVGSLCCSCLFFVHLLQVCLCVCVCVAACCCVLIGLLLMELFAAAAAA